MLTAKKDLVIPSSTSGLWFPGSNFFGGGVAGLPPPVLLSPRSVDIKKRQDELFSQLKDASESNYELSLTDLIIESDHHGDAKPVIVADKEEEEVKQAKKLSSRSERSVRRSRRAPENYYMTRKSSNTRNDDGVLLNMFIPTSLGRSFTWPSPPHYKSTSTKETLRKTSSSSAATKSAMDMRWVICLSQEFN